MKVGRFAPGSVENGSDSQESSAAADDFFIWAHSRLCVQPPPPGGNISVRKSIISRAAFIDVMSAWS